MEGKAIDQNPQILDFSATLGIQVQLPDDASAGDLMNLFLMHERFDLSNQGHGLIQQGLNEDSKQARARAFLHFYNSQYDPKYPNQDRVYKVTCQLNISITIFKKRINWNNNNNTLFTLDTWYTFAKKITIT